MPKFWIADRRRCGVPASYVLAGTHPLGTQTSWILVIAILVGVPIICVALNSNGVDSLAADGAFEAGLVWLQRNMEAYVAGVLLLVTAVVARIVPGRLLSRTLA
ncbi:MAG: hypothetical protein H6512_00980 [Acidimicrobiia bacterium]|nr:hypothetical protein [Acidimicrobiia bacterium]